MTSEFTDDQLYLIRDAFREMCYRSIVSRNLEDAREDLGIINVVQNYFGEYEYDDLNHFMLHNDGLCPELKAKMHAESENKAVEALVHWAKSGETEITADLEDDVEDYLCDIHINEGNCEEHIIGHRLIAIDHLIILCIRYCSSRELKKIDTIKQKLAEHFLPSSLPATD